MNKIQILKEQIKKVAPIRRFQKVSERKNQSNYDKIITNGLDKLVSDGILKSRNSWQIFRCEEYITLKSEYEKVKIDIPEPHYNKNYLTSLYILYNRLRSKPSHFGKGNEEKENDYNYYIKKWLEWLEEEEKVLLSSEKGQTDEI